VRAAAHLLLIFPLTFTFTRARALLKGFSTMRTQQR
jgi:hypothetical protein